ncbi:nitrous oxide reductase accessory protein NosL [Calidifontibacillus oryziterrae]|uniref:nitrous oxide reductase accessory protein NosL n=1 Tax=Calidifontibacillus oryziterrae TaxID=1191699 RepID=UPI0002FFBBA9|nr:nitrous oxide reductase accessory protein NosL [Calidifontibacillus oryziterrae]
MMKKLGLLLIVGLFVLSGCGQEVSIEPREVNPEIDACEVCNMSVAHVDFATQLIESDGTVHMYDDIGCMVEYVNGEGQNKEIAGQYVRDFESLEWVPIEQAYHAYHPEFWTPMAYGVVSFSSKERAEDYIKQEGKGEVIDYSGLAKLDWTMHH